MFEFFILSAIFLCHFILSRWVYWYALIFMPSTLAHELSHYLIAKVSFAKPTPPNLWPIHDGHQAILGHVQCSNLRWFNIMAVAFAPLLLAILAYKLYTYRFDIPLHPALTMLLCGYLLVGATPSRGDVDVVIRNPTSMWPIAVVATWFHFT